MTGLIVIGIVLLGFATYVSSISLALMVVSRSALEARLAAAGREAAGEWLFATLQPTRLAVSLVRVSLRVCVFAVVLIATFGLGEEAVVLTIGRLAAAVALSVAVLWVLTGILASALARYAAVGLIAGAMPLLRGLAFVCSPLTSALGFVDEAVRRLTGANLTDDDEVEAELLRSIGDRHREGKLDEESATLLENIVEFRSTDVGEVMTPRTDIDGLELTDDLAEIRTLIVKLGHSRIPVFEENLDHIVGVLYVKDLIRYLGEDASDFRLRPVLRQPIVVPETKPVRELLADFQRSEVHMAIVIDEYGGTAGLVTIEDVLEEIVGEIHDEHDPDDEASPSLTPIDETRAEVDGRYHIDDLNAELGLSLPEDDEFDTVGGFVLSTLGRVPSEGESFESHDARFTVLSSAPTHVRRVGIELLSDVPGNGRRRQQKTG